METHTRLHSQPELKSRVGTLNQQNHPGVLGCYVLYESWTFCNSTKCEIIYHDSTKKKNQNPFASLEGPSRTRKFPRQAWSAELWSQMSTLDSSKVNQWLCPRGNRLFHLKFVEIHKIRTTLKVDPVNLKVAEPTHSELCLHPWISS